MEQNDSDTTTYNEKIDTDRIDYSAIEARNEIQGQTHSRQENDGHLSENKKLYNKVPSSSSQSHKKKSNRPRNEITVETKKDIMKTSELQALLPRRRRVKSDPKGKKPMYNYSSENDDIEEGRYKNGGSSKKTKYKPGQKEKAKKKDVDDELDEKLKREREDRIRHFHDIDQYELPVEVVID
ncbi:2512_t:CDS:2 [Cetraspora pellucida]|uniref:2512_t:CDS:1 n=1 Tax=Cetraspora pellucida TaxID=1433469 RepID=A0ACA9KGZ8_9GLOM|nr:2512_t:CDS:2 [Cetraspora pellucida]